MRCCLRHFFCGLFPWLAWSITQSASAQTPAANGFLVLTNAAQVRALTPAEAAKRLPIRLRGVVIDNNYNDSFALMDSTAGVYASGSAGIARETQRGDLVEVEGVSNPGKFAPCVDVRSVRKLGSGKVPAAQLVDSEALFSGRLDAQWIEVSGIVRRVEPVWGGLDLEVNVEPGGGRILAHAAGFGRVAAVDSTVRLRAMCYHQFNETRQVIRPYLSIPEGEPILVEKPAITNLDLPPVRSIGSLMQFGVGQDFVHQLRVRGVVIYAQPGEGFWIHDAGRGIRVFCDRKDPLAVGVEVDVFGFVKHGDYGPIIEDAQFRTTGKNLSVHPIHLTEASEALDHDSDLVECDAVIQEQRVASDGCRLELADGRTKFPAVLRIMKGEALPSDWVPGTRVRVVGVCSVGFLTEPTTPGTLQPQLFQILLRSPTDVQILQKPPWWNARHVAWLLGGMAATLLLSVWIVLWIGRRRLREEALERLKSEAEFSAVWNERNRMARELHDTLAQGLGVISLQLEVAKRQLPAGSGARTTLEEAGTQTRASLGEVRNAIWNMRSQVLETGDLASALNGVLHSLVDRDRVKSELRVIGEPKRFAPVVENNLLRIGQEAIANAAKHAQAKQIEVVLKFERQQFELCVSDDGLGFDPMHPPASEGGFGLIGMRERAAELNGELTVTSAPGKGCVVKLVLPLTTA